MNDAVLQILREHAPILIVMIPLAAAALCVALPSGRAAWVIASIASLAVAAGALDVAFSVQHAGARLYPVGGWQAPLGITFRIDGLGAFGLSLVSAAAALSILSSIGPLMREVERGRRPIAQALCLIVTSGALGMIAAGDMFTAFAFMEMSALGSAALVGLGSDADRRAASAGFRVLLWSMTGAIFFAFGAGLMFVSTGSFDVARAAGVLNAAEHARGAVAGVALMMTSTILAPAFAASRMWGPGALTDQSAAGAIMWFGGDGLMMILMLVVSGQWVRSGDRARSLGPWLDGIRNRALLGDAPISPAQADAEHVDDEQAALNAYNRRMARLNGPRPSAPPHR
mgnify:CR=1 FL=1